MKKFLSDNKFGAKSRVLIVFTFILLFLWLATTTYLLFILSLISFVSTIVLNIIGLIKDKKKVLSIISIILVILIVAGVIYYFNFILPRTVEATVEGLLKSWGIGG